MHVIVPISAGDLIDRITILRIKAARVPDAAIRARVRLQLTALSRVRDGVPAFARKSVRIRQKRLHACNKILWDAENRLRALEREKDFGREFVALARRVYKTNDRRARLKQEIDGLMRSEFRDDKWCAPR
jgi:hypothetical protein